MLHVLAACNKVYGSNNSEWHWSLSCIVPESDVKLQASTGHSLQKEHKLLNFLLHLINSLRPRQDGRHFTDTFKHIFLNENVRTSIKTSLKHVPKSPINNIPALVQIMAWRRPGEKPLSEPMMVRLLTHTCITRPQWVNSLWPSDTIWWQRSGSTLAQVMACCPKPLPEPMLTDHQRSPVKFILGQFHKRCLNHLSLKSVWKLHS